MVLARGPFGATLVKPSIEATNIYPKNVELEWGPAQFAMGYKLYVGFSWHCRNSKHIINYLYKSVVSARKMSYMPKNTLRAVDSTALSI